MQFIIPMAGTGTRFVKKGFNTPKPFIKSGSNTLIEGVVNQFTELEDVLFICNEKHLSIKTPDYKKKLKKLKKNSKVLSIKSHKLGPVESLLQAEKYVDKTKPVIISYCDCISIFDETKFYSFLKNNKRADGIIFYYNGFHPHLRRSQNHAYIKFHKEIIVDIREKQSFTLNPLNEPASSGIYYFSNGEKLISACKKLVEKKLHVKNEFFVSMLYKILIEDSNLIKGYKIDYFLNLGTPEDLEDFKKWDKAFKKFYFINKTISLRLNANLLMPAAGKGERFSEKGYKLSKPLIDISGQKMFEMALKCFPEAKSQTIILKEEVYKKINKKNNSAINFIPINKFTKGQAETCLIGIDKQNYCKPIIILSCDMGIMLKNEQIKTLNKKDSADIFVFVSKIDLSSTLNQKHFSWISLDNNKAINKILIKPIKKPSNYNHYLLGAFQFKSASLFKKLFNLMRDKNYTVNEEYYIDNMIKLALENNINCQPLLIEHFFNWGTPIELDTYNYWKKCFNIWTLHDFKIKTF